MGARLSHLSYKRGTLMEIASIKGPVMGPEVVHEEILEDEAETVDMSPGEFIHSGGDGRPRVTTAGTDLLLEQLRKHHGESRPDIYPAWWRMRRFNLD